MIIKIINFLTLHVIHFRESKCFGFRLDELRPIVLDDHSLLKLLWPLEIGVDPTYN